MRELISGSLFVFPRDRDLKNDEANNIQWGRCMRYKDRGTRVISSGLVLAVSVLPSLPAWLAALLVHSYLNSISSRLVRLRVAYSPTSLTTCGLFKFEAWVHVRQSPSLREDMKLGLKIQACKIEV